MNILFIFNRNQITIKLEYEYITKKLQSNTTPWRISINYQTVALHYESHIVYKTI